MAGKGMTVMQQGSEEFTINDPNITNEFDSSAAYVKGDYVNYQGNLYRFVADHAAGAWNASHVEQVKLGHDVTSFTAGLKTGGFYSDGIFGNIIDQSEVKDGVYPTASSGKIVYISQQGYNTVIAPVGEFLPFYASYVRFFAYLGLDKETIIGGTVTDLGSNIEYSAFTPEDCEYIVLGYSTTGAPAKYDLNIGYAEVQDTAYVPVWMKSIGKQAKVAYKSSMSNGEGMITGLLSEPRKSLAISFSANITSFSKVIVGLTVNRYSYSSGAQINRVEVDATNIKLIYNDGGANVTVAHGLTIENNIQINITTDEKATCNVLLTSNGETATAQALYTYAQVAQGLAFAMSDGSALTDCVLGWVVGDIKKDKWYFGDSYTAFADDRWPRFAPDWIDNILLDGYGGETSDYSIKAFSNYVTCDRPRYAIWSLGMNDPADSGTTPSAEWMKNTNRFLAICEHFRIVPVLCTVPSIPTKNHEGKNAYIRSSGYRYIDFAKAVDPDGDGTWITGMLAADGVHPTAKGAKALYARMIADFPEFYIN